MRERIRKIDEEQRIIMGEVYSPDLPDSQGEFMNAMEIQKMAHSFLQRFQQGKVDTNHNHDLVDAVVVESFIAQKGQDLYIPGSWVVGMHIVDPILWEAVKSGEYNGFSLDALVHKTPVEVEIELPEQVNITTQPAKDGHVHTAVLKFDMKTGKLMAGQTDEVNGHRHEITKGTLTDDAEGHAHRYSFLEALVND